MAERLVAQEVFGFLRPEQVNAISEAAERMSFASGETVYQQGAKADYFYVVLEGEVTLRLPGKGGVSLLIDELTEGEMFGSCVCLSRETYALTAQCVSNSVLLKIKSAALQELMDRDLKMGYALQSQISAIYYGRYIETMQKLQAIVMNLPIAST